jgi:hypothetical protein
VQASYLIIGLARFPLSQPLVINAVARWCTLGKVDYEEFLDEFYAVAFFATNELMYRFFSLSKSSYRVLLTIYSGFCTSETLGYTCAKGDNVRSFLSLPLIFLSRRQTPFPHLPKASLWKPIQLL